MFKPPGLTPKTSMADLAKLWHSAIHVSTVQETQDDDQPDDDADETSPPTQPDTPIPRPLSSNDLNSGRWKPPGSSSNPIHDFIHGDEQFTGSRRRARRTVISGEKPSTILEDEQLPDADGVVPLGRPSLPEMRSRLSEKWFTSLYVAQNYGFQKLHQLKQAHEAGFYDAIVLREPEWAFQAGFNLYDQTNYDAKQDGTLLALAARFPLSTTSGAIFNGDITLDEFRSHWSAFEDCLRSGAEIPATILHAVQIGVSAWFELRSQTASRDLSNKGLDAIITAIHRQEHEVAQLWRVYALRLSRDGQNLSQQDRIAVTSTTYFNLLHPFSRAFLNAGQRDKIRAEALEMRNTLGASGASPSTTFAAYSQVPKLPPPPPTSGGWTSPFPAPSHAQPAYRQAFLGLPASSSIIGPALAVFTTHNSKTCWHCTIPGHHVWECPRRYYEKFREPCPGFDHQGHRNPSDWTPNGELQQHARLAWRSYKVRHGLVKARDVPNEPNF